MTNAIAELSQQGILNILTIKWFTTANLFNHKHLRWEVACICPDKLRFVMSRCRKSKIPDDECLDCKPDIYRSPCGRQRQ